MVRNSEEMHDSFPGMKIPTPPWAIDQSDVPIQDAKPCNVNKG